MPAHLGLRDMARLASVGIRTRKLRAGLSALGMSWRRGHRGRSRPVGFVQAALLNEINKLGTKLLTVTNGQTLFGQTAELPEAAPGMIGRIGPVTNVQYVGAISNANVFKSPLIPSIDTNALSVDAASLGFRAWWERPWPRASS